MSAISASGSRAPLAAVPALATIQNGLRLFLRSASIASLSACTLKQNRSSVGMTRTLFWPRPRTSAAFGSDIAVEAWMTVVSDAVNDLATVRNDILQRF